MVRCTVILFHSQCRPLMPMIFVKSCQVTVVVGIGLSAAFDSLSQDTTTAPARRVRCVWNGAVLDPVYLEVRQAWPASVIGNRARARSASRWIPGPILFAVYRSPVANVIAEHGVHYHQYADDTQLHLTMRSDNTAAGLSVLSTRVSLTSDFSICRTVCS